MYLYISLQILEKENLLAVRVDNGINPIFPNS